jgi:hypothetical protein
MCGAEEAKPLSRRPHREVLEPRIARHRETRVSCSHQVQSASSKKCKAEVGGTGKTTWISESDGEGWYRLMTKMGASWCVKRGHQISLR